MAVNFFAKTRSDKKCELYIYDSIGADFFGEGITAKSVAEELKGLPQGADMDVYINSPGGSVFEGLAIYNQLIRWAGKKTVHIDGIAASIASIISMAGDERNIASNALFMIHQAYGITMGNSGEMRKYADSLDKIDATLLDTYVSRTKGDAGQIRAWLEAETWMDADEAVARGFATAKTAEKQFKAEFPLLAKFNRVPDQLRRQANSINVRLASINTRADKYRRPAGANT